jgi:hypothetical protein
LRASSTAGYGGAPAAAGHTATPISSKFHEVFGDEYLSRKVLAHEFLEARIIVLRVGRGRQMLRTTVYVYHGVHSMLSTANKPDF